MFVHVLNELLNVVIILLILPFYLFITINRTLHLFITFAVI